jgi:cobalt/nickel transport system permease protein
MFQERYQAGDSILHRLDPRVKVVTALILITGIVLTPERAWPAYPLLWTLVSTLAVIGRLGAWRVSRLGGLALPFTLAAAALLFTLPGKPVITMLGLTISDAGVSRFLSIVLKSWLAVQVTLILSMTTPFTDLLWGLSSLRIPAVLVAIISFMYRYLFTLNDEAQRLLRARTARSGTAAGQKYGGSLMWRAQVAGGMVGSLFLRSYERSERVYAAMLARGYTGKMQTTSPPPLTWRSVGHGAIPVLVLVIIETLAVLWWKA